MLQNEKVSQEVSLQVVNEVFEKMRKTTDNGAFSVSSSEYEIGQQCLYADEQIDRLENLENHPNMLVNLD